MLLTGAPADEPACLQACCTLARAQYVCSMLYLDTLSMATRSARSAMQRIFYLTDMETLPAGRPTCAVFTRPGSLSTQAQRRRRQLRRPRPAAHFPWRAYEGVRAALGGHQQQGLDLLGRAGLIPGSTLAAYRCA
jgi:hypothetical protein